MGKQVYSGRLIQHNSIIIDALLFSMALSDEMCLSGRHIPVVFFLMLFKFGIEKRYLVNKSIFWLLFMLCYTTILGIRLPDNSENFSILYNTSVFLVAIMIQLLLMKYKYKNQLIDVLDFTVLYTTILSGFFIISHEYSTIMYRWRDYLGGQSDYRLGSSTDINSNVIEWLFGVLGLFSVYLIIFHKRKKQLIIYIIQIIILFFTGSKNGLLFAVIPIIYVLLKSLRKFKPIHVAIAILAIIALWTAIHENAVLYTLVGKRFDSMLSSIAFLNGASESISKTPIDITSTVKRLRMIECANKMYWKHPVIGRGIGAFAKYSGYGYYCHNNYMEILVSGGIIGFLLYYSYIIFAGIKSLYLRKGAYRDLAIIIIIFILLSDFGTVNFYSRLVFLFPKIILFILVSGKLLDYSK